MPSELAQETAIAGVRVLALPVIDFHFGLFSLSKSCNDPDKPVPGWVNELGTDHPALMERIGNFWPARGLGEFDGQPYFEWGELLVAAWRSGRMFANDVTQLISELDGALSSRDRTPPLYSEPRAIEDLVDRRLALLRTSARDRAEYIQLMTDFWEVFRPYWERNGRSDSLHAVEDLMNKVAQGVDLRALMPGNSFLHKDEYQPQIAAAQARGELVVVPLGLGGAGQLYWALPGMVIVGAGIESAEREVRRRERAERVASKLKVLSDPTRLQILFELLRPRHHAATVTELASQFGLSQPTVSVHIKMLREAGLVRSERDGNQVHYQADEALVRDFVGSALQDIVTSAPGRE